MEKSEVIALAKKNNLEIDFIDYNIAFRVGNTVAVNEDLLKYDDYCRTTLNHEFRHTSENKFMKKDLAMDIFEGSLITCLFFAFKHPRAFRQFLPFGKYKNKWFIDLNLIIVYGIGLIALCIYLGLAL